MNSIKHYWNNVFKLTSATIFTQLLNMLSSPFLARIYTPEHFGIVGFYNSVYGIMLVISALRYEQSIIISEKDEENKLFSLALIFVCATSFFFFFVLILLKNIFYLNFHFINDYLLYLMPLSLLLFGINNVINSLGNKLKIYSIISYSILILNLITIIMKLTLGLLFNPKADYLILSDIIGVTLSIVFLAIYLIKIYNIKLILKNSFNDYFVLLRKYINYLKYDNIAAFLNNLSWMLPAILLSYFFSVKVVGYYALGFTIIRLPMNLIGKSVSNVFYQSTAEYIDDHFKQKTIVEDTIINLFTLGLMPTLIILIWGDILFAFVFGSKWYYAGVYSQILSIWGLVWLISSPISTLYYVYNLQKKFLFLMILNILFRILSLSIGGLLNDIYISLFLFALSGILLYGYMTLYTTKYIGISFKDLIKRIVLINKSISIPIIILLTSRLLLNENTIIAIILIAIITLTYYYGLISSYLKRSI
ncbi:O-antigen translocase [Melioribacter roseus P3M-2]|uniref:O-antigen translocase n=1 Tax=Melioribacter roseus (strain DSM 23840 / JCM 17771 / VKM B-2668 / P3M-2) TaxID=1191523 RepID=I7A406_MELRP|nr:oligosaccharide flippase family protein [Melioribacter roseus]AFN75913.1 O-antigen translocase [Melioribacter roseus P3M-2]